MNTYLIELSVKRHDDANFRQVMAPTYMDIEHARELFEEHVIIKGSQTADGMARFYSSEGLYPIARLLILDTSDIPGLQSDIDKLLGTLVMPVSFIAPLVPYTATGEPYIASA